MNYGELVSVSCSISGGDLPVKMSWHFNGDPVSDNPDLQDVILEMRGQRIYNLVIESVSAKHIGNYSCTTNNIAGRTDFTAELFVNGLSNNYAKLIYIVNFYLSLSYVPNLNYFCWYVVVHILYAMYRVFP